MSSSRQEFSSNFSFIFLSFLQVQPSNRQDQDLEKVVKKRLDRDGKIGMAVVGGATLAFGALVGLGLALAKKK